MRLHSRKHFLLGLVCLLPIIHEYKNFDGAKSVVWITFFVVMGVRSIRTAFSRELLEEEKILAERERRVLRRMGPLWKIPILVLLAPIIVGAAAFSLLWPSEWANVLLLIGMIASFALAIWFRVRRDELMKQEKEKDEENKS